MTPRRGKGLKVVGQRRKMDCGVAVLAMLLERSYGDVSAAARVIVPKFATRGMDITQLQAIAGWLGVPLKRVYRKRDYLNGATGILGVLGEEMYSGGHFVILKSGVIVDPAGSEVWDVATYMSKHKARPCTLLVVAKGK